MNLMKLFNINYLKQNFKKSKVILSIFVGLIPILNTICLIMNYYDNGTDVFSFGEVSIINFIGVYILPVIVSICLFNYIYKKKSVDFINSMPISRKSIFVTNTIFGIIIFLSMLIVNIILISILTLILNIPIPFVMLLDYLWYWFIVYMFTFSATNLAMTISGNAITQIVLTLLLVFLIPFTHIFTTSLSTYNTHNKLYLHCDKEECIPKEYYCYDDLECNINKNSNMYEIDLSKEENYNYTPLFNYIYTSLEGDNTSLINTPSIVKTILLSILYMILGFILFVKRKMEVSETSFKNIHVHNIVKSLTFIPIVAFAYIVCKEANIISIVFTLVIIFIYSFVYDLVTKRSITNIKLSMVYFILTISILTIFYSVVEVSSNKDDKEILKYSDIKEVAIDISNYNRGYYNADMDRIFIENKELIKLVIKNSFDNYKYDEVKEHHLETYIKTKDNKIYRNYIRLTDSEYNNIISILSNNKDYNDYYKNINLDKVYAVKLGRNLYTKENTEPVLKLVEDSLKNLSLKEFLDLQKKYNSVSDNFYISLYTYENHDKKEFRINGYINYTLLNSIVNSNNRVLKENIEHVIPEDYEIYYSESYMLENFEIDYFVLRNAKTEMYNFILKELEKEVDMKKEFITLEVNFNSNSYLFTTNNINEFKRILDNKYNEIKDSDEYKYYYGDLYYDKYTYDIEDYSYDY